jgi:DNA repair protein RecO (recombination protein O)
MLDGIEIVDLNFHLKFMIEISSFLGFGIHAAEELMHQIRDYGSWHNRSLYTSKIDLLINGQEIVLGNKTRREILDFLVQFYQVQLEQVGNLKSLRVLKAIMEV